MTIWKKQNSNRKIKNFNDKRSLPSSLKGIAYASAILSIKAKEVPVFFQQYFFKIFSIVLVSSDPFLLQQQRDFFWLLSPYILYWRSLDSWQLYLQTLDSCTNSVMIPILKMEAIEMGAIEALDTNFPELVPSCNEIHSMVLASLFTWFVSTSWIWNVSRFFAILRRAFHFLHSNSHYFTAINELLLYLSFYSCVIQKLSLKMFIGCKYKRTTWHEFFLGDWKNPSLKKSTKNYRSRKQ